eukprot:scaffold103407_cov15-Phaeocystis_antarctica.AAC.1
MGLGSRINSPLPPTHHSALRAHLLTCSPACSLACSAVLPPPSMARLAFHGCTPLTSLGRYRFHFDDYTVPLPLLLPLPLPLTPGTASTSTTTPCPSS